MFIDIVVIVLMLVAIFKGLQKGFVVAVFSFFAFIIGLAAAIKLSAITAAYIGENISISQRWLPVIAFAVVFFLVAFLVYLGAKAIEGLLRVVALGWLNKLGGVLLFSLLYLFIFSVLLFYAGQLQLLNPLTIQSSVTYSFLYPVGPKVINGLGLLLPFFKNMFEELSAFFDGYSKYS